jgi:hypothetical protein
LCGQVFAPTETSKQQMIKANFFYPIGGEEIFQKSIHNRGLSTFDAFGIVI